MLGTQTTQFIFFRKVLAVFGMLTFSTVHLFIYVHEINFIIGSALAMACLIVAFTMVYHIEFGMKPSANTLIPLTFFGIYCFSVFTFQGDLVLSWSNKISESSEPHWPWKFFTFSLLVLITSAWTAYRNARSTLTIKAYTNKPWIDLWLMWIYPNNHSYDTQLTISKIWGLILLMSILAGLVVWVGVTNLSPPHPKYISAIVLHVALALITLILHMHAGILIGENIHIAAFCNRYGFESLSHCNHDDKLKWRHDYVKYHLPAPIRALNLRLFNQHIEAYQAYLASSKR
ncbi:hypothetical protein [Limnobacter sp.]|uniref:hypothetical protein n=1 Tax=Limnobacter sp. TaxID=2003368 RepID=UPI00351635C7